MWGVGPGVGSLRCILSGFCDCVDVCSYSHLPLLEDRLVYSETLPNRLLIRTPPLPFSHFSLQSLEDLELTFNHGRRAHTQRGQSGPL